MEGVTPSETPFLALLVASVNGVSWAVDKEDALKRLASHITRQVTTTLLLYVWLSQY